MPKVRITGAQQRHMRQEREDLEAYRRREARKSRAQRQLTVRSDGVTRCSKCPPTHCCDDCARINKGRQQAGLIRPRGSPEPHPNNCLPCIPHSQKYQGQRPLTIATRSYKVVSLDITPLGGGWFRSAALLGKDEIYVKRVRGRDAAMTFARQAMVCIRQGLEWDMANA